MESCLTDMHWDWCIIYLDDMIIFLQTPQEHIQWLRGIFKKLWVVGLKLKPSQCEFFQSWISYLGHIVSKEGKEADPKEISAIQD